MVYSIRDILINKILYKNLFPYLKLVKKIKIYKNFWEKKFFDFLILEKKWKNQSKNLERVTEISFKIIYHSQFSIIFRLFSFSPLILLLTEAKPYH